MDESSSEYETDTTDTESIDSEDSFYEDDSDNIFDTEQLYEVEQTSEELNGKYFIGSYKNLAEENILLFTIRIHRNTFFQFKSEQISKYFFWYSGVPMQKNPPVEILQLQVLPDQTYIAVVKTFYLRIIQRAWKKVFKQRQEYIYQRKCLGTIRNYEVGIRSCTHSFHGLQGLLINTL